MAVQAQLPSQGNPFQRLLKYFLEPRSENRDERFRERTIRATVFIVTIAVSLSIISTFLVFHNELKLVSLPSLYLSLFVLCIGAAYALGTKRLFAAGALMVALFFLTAMGLTVIPDTGGQNLVAAPTYMLSILAAALVLPRSTLIPLGITSAVAGGLLQEIGHPADPNNAAIIWGGAFLFIVEALFLRQLRVEFDSRLAAMRQSILDAEAARKEADEANQAKSQFLANMSHELRTPLNAIIGYTEIMLNGMAGTFTDKQTQLQSFIQINAKRLLALINDILDLAKIESGTVEVLATLSSPRKAVGDVIDAMQSLAQPKNIYLKATFDETTPEAILIDVHKIQQIVTNLVSNAIKFTTEGGVEVHVSSNQPNAWQIKVSDTGRGMPPDAANYIFESFRQVDSSDSREHKGTGLGLAITKRLIEKLGGDVKVTSEIGKGSTFTVTMPRISNAEKTVVPVVEPSTPAKP